MMFAGVIPWDGLPGWMYHAQERPPSHDFNPNLPGISWVDLVFPFFLFAMGAAIPLAYKEGEKSSWYSPTLLAFRRGGVLIAFAIFNQHARPYILKESPTSATWLMGLAGFLIPFAILVRLPTSTPRFSVIAIRVLGLAGALAFLALAKYPDGSGFKMDRADPIILVLAAASTFGTILWRATKDRVDLRLGVLALIVALRIGALTPESIAAKLWNWSTPFGLFQVSFLGYLAIAIPGTVVGDLLCRASEAVASKDKKPNELTLALASFAIVPITLVVFFGRTVSPLWIAVPIGICVSLVHKSSMACVTNRKTIDWGAFWLTFGILLGPFQGGIKKDPPTLSYGFVTAGLACFLLVSLRILEQNRPRSVALNFSAATGQNPLLAYQALTNLVAPLWALCVVPWLVDLTPGTALGVVRAILETLCLGAVVGLFKKYRIVMRA